MGTKLKTIKVCLTNRGEDSETPWAEDLGPAPGRSGSRKVRLVNVPFLHAKPTWGDVIAVAPVEDGLPTWDRDGVAWNHVGAKIVEDGGRWAMIVDYAPHADTTADVAYRALAVAAEEVDIVCEGAWGPERGKPGRAYLAVRNAASDRDVMGDLRAAELPCELTQIHPVPAKPKAKAKAKSKPKPKAKPKPKPRAKAKTAKKRAR
jgi:hypothetical protein